MCEHLLLLLLSSLENSSFNFSRPLIQQQQLCTTCGPLYINFIFICLSLHQSLLSFLFFSFTYFYFFFFSSHFFLHFFGGGGGGASVSEQEEVENELNTGPALGGAPPPTADPPKTGEKISFFARLSFGYFFEITRMKKADHQQLLSFYSWKRKLSS